MRAPLPLRTQQTQKSLTFKKADGGAGGSRQKVERDFWFAFATTSSKKLHFNLHLKLRAFHFAFLRPCGDPRRYAYSGFIVFLVFTHTAHASHRPLTFVRAACSVCARVRLVASVEFVVFKVVCASRKKIDMCLSHPPSTRTNAHIHRHFLSFFINHAFDSCPKLLCIPVRK